MTGRPFVGRNAEWAVLTAALADHCSAVLCGPLGSGKTRLADELVRHAQRAGYRAVRTLATQSMSAVPLGALASLLPEQDAAADSHQSLMSQAVLAIRRRSAARPLLIVIDDAHLLDEASAELVHHVVRTRVAFVCATIRSGEPRQGWLDVLFTDPDSTQVELPPLTLSEVDELVSVELSGSVDAATTRQIAAVSAGNPLFVKELVLACRRNGTLRPVAGRWAWTGELSVGTRLAELVHARLASLGGQQRAALEVLALAEPLGTALLLSVIDPEVLPTLRERGLVTIERDGRRSTARLAHPVYADALRPNIGPMRRRAVLRALAHRLSDTGARRRDDIIRLCLWRLEGGGGHPTDEPSADELLAAARRARARFDHRLVERFAATAVECGGGALATILLGDALYWQGRHREAAELLRTVPGDASPDLLVEWATTGSSNEFWGLGDQRRAIEVTLAAERLLPSGAELDRVSAHRATLSLFAGQVDTAVEAGEQVFGRTADDEARVRALAALLPAWACAGRPDHAARTAMPAGDLTDERPLLIAEVLAGQATANLFAGHLNTAERIAQAAYDEALALPAHDFRGLWATLLGQVQLARGRVDSARRRFREATDLLRHREGVLPWAFAGLACAAALLGEVTQSAAAITEAGRPPPLFAADLQLAEAWHTAAIGDLVAARRMAITAADVAASCGYRALELFALHDAFRMGATSTHIRLAAVHVDGPRAAAIADHVAAFRARDPHRLRASARRFHSLGLHLLAAETASQAAAVGHRLGSPGWRADWNTACQWVADCQAACSPMLSRPMPGSPAWRLTERERTVATLSCAGLSTRDIAARLRLSTRTVENHMARVYTKLDVNGRSAVAAALRKASLNPDLAHDEELPCTAAAPPGSGCGSGRSSDLQDLRTSEPGETDRVTCQAPPQH